MVAAWSLLAPLKAEEIRTVTGKPVVPDVTVVGDRQARLKFYVNLAEGYIRRKEYEAAVEAYTKAMEQRPGKKDTYAVLLAIGDIYLVRREYEKAIEFYQEAVSLLPGKEAARLSLGKAYEESELYELAQEAYLAAVKKSPKSYDANFRLATLYLKQGLNSQAMEYYRRALTLNPCHELYRYMSRCAENMGDINLALAMLRQATYLKMDYDDLMTIGRMNVKQKRHKEAEEAYSQAVNLDPDRADAYVSLALLYLEDDELTAAEQLLLIAREKLTADEGIIHFFLGTIYYRQHDLKAAQAEISAAKRTARGSLLSGYSGKFGQFLLSPYAHQE